MRGSGKAALAAAAALALALAGCGDSDLTVPAPTAEQAAEVAKELARATEAQGVCYGWALFDSSSSTPVSRGSSLGADVAVESDPARCPRWVEVDAWITYYPDSSESEDSARLQVRSTHLPGSGRVQAKLEDIGLNSRVFVDDPAWSIARAALALPLLTAEEGAADPLPTPSAPPAAAPRQLPEPGSDFWRDRLGLVITAGVLLLVAGGFVAIGVFAGRRQRVPVSRKR